MARLRYGRQRSATTTISHSLECSSTHARGRKSGCSSITWARIGFAFPRNSRAVGLAIAATVMRGCSRAAGHDPSRRTRGLRSCGWLCRDGGARLVEIDELAVQAELVEVTAG